MKRLNRLFPVSMIAAALAAIFTTAILPAMAPIQKAEAATQKTITLRSSATSTYNLVGGVATGTAVFLGDKTNALKGGAETYGDKMIVFLNVTAASGNLALTVEGSYDGTNYATLAPASAWTAVTTSTGNQCRTYLGPIPPYVRYMGTSSVSSSSYTYSVYGIVNK